MHAQQRDGLIRDRLRVVAGVGAVGRADLDQGGAGLAHHVGDAEAAADLDHLPARDDHLAAAGERGEREQQRRGVVVDGDACLRAGDAPQQPAEVRVARPAFAALQVEFQVGVAAPGLRHRLDRRLRERGAAEVGVDHDAGGVDRAAQAASQSLRALHDRLGGGAGGRGAGALDLASVLVQHGAGDLDHGVVAVARRERGDQLVGKQPFDGGERAIGIAHRAFD